MPPQSLALVATLVSFASHGNYLEMRLDHGSAELLWITPSTFRFRRALEGALPQVQRHEGQPVPVETDDTPGALRTRSKFLEVTIEKHGLLVRVRRMDGAPLMADASEPRPSGGGVAWERRNLGARFYGLGPRTELSFDLRGKSLDTAEPFLISTAGCGEYHSTAGTYHFDFTAADRYQIQAPAVDYFFYYGPSLKQIFEEHHGLHGTSPAWQTANREASWTALQASFLRLVHGSMSAMLEPSFDLAAYANAPPEMQQRARQIGSLVDDVSPGRVGLSGFRKQLDTFFATYAAELQERGFPIWHPLPFQFPEDAECALHADEFMLGDEMLVAPIYQPGRKRSLYLPQGSWTDLETNEVFRGRQTIAVETDALPVFARNGTIVPLDSAAGMALHYFPTLAAEFFLLETDPDGWSQVHAAPAADIMRLEIEARKERDYQWVVHHIDRPVAVGFEAHRYPEVSSRDRIPNDAWFYDAPHRNLHVRVHVAAGEIRIVNLSF